MYAATIAPGRTNRNADGMNHQLHVTKPAYTTIPMNRLQNVRPQCFAPLQGLAAVGASAAVCVEL